MNEERENGRNAARSARHDYGQTTPLPLDALLDDDPDLWLTAADMRAWSEAHPCECEALCICDR
jgi:hypothetical protein